MGSMSDDHSTDLSPAAPESWFWGKQEKGNPEILIVQPRAETALMDLPSDFRHHLTSQILSREEERQHVFEVRSTCTWGSFMP